LLAAGEQVRAIFVVEPDEEAILANIVARRRGMTGWSEAEVRTDARVKWLYGQWLADEAGCFDMPVLEPRPWNTFIERLIRCEYWFRVSFHAYVRKPSVQLCALTTDLASK